MTSHGRNLLRERHRNKELEDLYKRLNNAGGEQETAKNR